MHASMCMLQVSGCTPRQPPSHPLLQLAIGGSQQALQVVGHGLATPVPLPLPSSVQVSWVQPRILTMPQVSGLASRLDGWVDKVATAALTLEEEAVGVVEPAAA